MRFRVPVLVPVFSSRNIRGLEMESTAQRVVPPLAGESAVSRRRLPCHLSKSNIFQLTNAWGVCVYIALLHYLCREWPIPCAPCNSTMKMTKKICRRPSPTPSSEVPRLTRTFPRKKSSKIMRHPNQNVDQNQTLGLHPLRCPLLCPRRRLQRL